MLVVPRCPFPFAPSSRRAYRALGALVAILSLLVASMLSRAARADDFMQADTCFQPDEEVCPAMVFAEVSKLPVPDVELSLSTEDAVAACKNFTAEHFDELSPTLSCCLEAAGVDGNAFVNPKVCGFLNARCGTGWELEPCQGGGPITCVYACAIDAEPCIGRIVGTGGSHDLTLFYRSGFVRVRASVAWTVTGSPAPVAATKPIFPATGDVLTFPERAPDGNNVKVTFDVNPPDGGLISSWTLMANADRKVIARGGPYPVGAQSIVVDSPREDATLWFVYATPAPAAGGPAANAASAGAGGAPGMGGAPPGMVGATTGMGGAPPIMVGATTGMGGAPPIMVGATTGMGGAPPIMGGVGGGAGMSCECTGGVDSMGAAIDPTTTSCGSQICGIDFNLWECQPTGWMSLGGSCGDCMGDFIDSRGVTIDPASTYLGAQVCGTDFQTWECEAGIWMAVGTPCGSDGGV
jgi:hypothetical protein